jgi:NADH-quinone oxidoreductase subunit G
MVEVEIDGKKVEVAEGSMLISAATAAGAYVPHFCYHKKLSIAANCRMCLVDVEKAPKPLPACATPVAQGMKVHTKSEKAIKAQKGVMEFLLINHPLDCPICDQGGECQLQDLAVGYGASSSRYDQAKRVVFHKPMGPLISAQEMSRCIHCTRCVRFGQEVAGVMEIGMAGRGEHSEIMSFVGRSVESELSGNMIDVCPVGALTSKPFRYSARTWELSRLRSVAAHDSLGSNLTVQVKANKVMRVLPYENEDVNECWISDRDRFSYEGLNSPDRLTAPMIKQDGQWQTVDWQTALEYAGQTLSSIKLDAGAGQVGFLVNPNSSLEELSLMGQLARSYGSDNVDFRLRQSDTSMPLEGTPWLGMKVSEVAKLDRLLLVGAAIRQDQPLLAARIRQAAKRGLKVNSIHGMQQDLLMPVANQWAVSPSQWVLALSQVNDAIRALKGGETADQLSARLPSQAVAIARSLNTGEKVAVLLGNSAQYHGSFNQLLQLAQAISSLTSGRFGILGDSANAVGGYVAKAFPQSNGASAAQMFAAPKAMRAFVLLNVEPSQDIANSAAAMGSLKAAKSVIAMSAFKTPDLLEIADCLLPITPFSESPATYINTEGRVQSSQAVVKPLGQARPGWKVLRVLGNLLELSGFDADSADEVRDAVLKIAGTTTEAEVVTVNGLKNALPHWSGTVPLQASPAIERLALVPQYRTDAIVRRADSLQETRSSRLAHAAMAGVLMERLGLTAGSPARFTQGEGFAQLIVERDDTLAANTVRIDAAREETIALAAMFGEITVSAVALTSPANASKVA